MDTPDCRQILDAMMRAALSAADPRSRIGPQDLPPPPRGRTIVVGAGKASAAMVQAVEPHLPPDTDGLVIVPHGSKLPARRIEIVEAAHPVPDEHGRAAARRILDLVSGLTSDDLVIALVSGGGSALLSLPGEGIALAEKQALTRGLLKSGASIGEMNTVRRHVSAIKGGRLAAAAHPARVASLVVSDVPGDDPAAISSGPTVGDPTTAADARAILARYPIDVPDSITAFLASAAAETPKPDDPRLAGASVRVIASGRMALDAAGEVARAAGLAVLDLGDAIEGEAREVAKVMAGIARSIAKTGIPVPRPAVILSGGETTVTVRGNGRGGRNAEFLLAFAIETAGEGFHALAIDTDGIDGMERNAGAVVGPDTIARARAAGLDARARLADNDAYGFFETLGDLVVTGPTGTNVNDFRAVLVP